MKDIVELEKASVLKADQDVLITQYKSYTEILEEDAKEIDNAHLTMSQGGDMFVIVDMSSGNTKIKRNAEEYFAKRAKMVPYTKAVAIIKEPKGIRLSRVLGKKFIFPYKEFKSKEEALNWINSLRN